MGKKEKLEVDDNIDNIKRIDIKEFRQKGYLQELNRRFLHPLGLALEVIVLENKQEVLSGIWDYREEKEGIYYDIKNSGEERKTKFKTNKNFIDKEFGTRMALRREELGFDIEPIE